MSKPDLGIKRKCQECGAPFFDLSKKKIECPKCGAAFTPAPQAKSRRPAPTPSEKPSSKDAKDTEDVGATKKAEEQPATKDADAGAGDADAANDGNGDGVTVKNDELDDEDMDDDDNDKDLIEDTSELGGDDDDMSEVKEHIDDGVEDKN